MNGLPRYDNRVDGTQKEVVEVLKSRRVPFCYTFSAGRGFPDLVIFLNGYTVPVEVKTETGSLTGPQLDFFKYKKGYAVIVRSALEMHVILDIIESTPDSPLFDKLVHYS